MSWTNTIHGLKRLKKKAMAMEEYVGLVIIVVIVITAIIYIMKKVKESGL